MTFRQLFSAMIPAIYIDKRAKYESHYTWLVDGLPQTVVQTSSVLFRAAKGSHKMLLPGAK